MRLPDLDEDEVVDSLSVVVGELQPRIVQSQGLEESIAFVTRVMATALHDDELGQRAEPGDKLKQVLKSAHES